MEQGYYYWKVVASDGRGGTAESETRRFVAITAFGRE
jgi:hypothetical protein